MWVQPIGGVNSATTATMKKSGACVVCCLWGFCALNPCFLVMKLLHAAAVSDEAVCGSNWKLFFFVGQSIFQPCFF